MREDYTLLTPENVELRYDVAGIGSRLAAAWIDYTIIAFAYLAFTLAGAFILGLLREAFPRTLGPNSQYATFFAYGTLAVTILLAFFGWWGYFILFELTWNGQTPGKRALGLRVVGGGGQPIAGTASLVRNLLRAVDLMFFIGVLTMLIDRSSRRLGDLAAGTLVIREPRAQGRAALTSVEIPTVPDERVEALPNAGRLTMAHYTLMRDFFARRDRMPGRQADVLATRLAADLARVLEVPPNEVGDPGTFIATAARAFEARHRYYDAPV